MGFFQDDKDPLGIKKKKEDPLGILKKKESPAPTSTLGDVGGQLGGGTSGTSQSKSGLRSFFRSAASQIPEQPKSKSREQLLQEAGYIKNKDGLYYIPEEAKPVEQKKKSPIPDPVGDIINPIAAAYTKAESEYKTRYPTNRFVSESVAQKPLIKNIAKEREDKEISTAFEKSTKELDEASNIVTKNIFPSPLDAKDYLKTMTAEHDIEDLKDNKTVQLAFNKWQKYENVKERYNKNPDLNQLAVDLEREADPNFDKQVLVLEGGEEDDRGLDNYERVLPGAVQGAMVERLINDPNIQALAYEEPKVREQLDELKDGGIYKKYPERGEIVARNIISREYQKRKANKIINPIFDKSSYLNNLAEELFKNDSSLMEIYQTRLKGNWEGKVDTPGLVDEFATGAKGAFEGMGESFKDLIGAGKSERERIEEGLTDQYSQVQSGISGAWQKLGHAANFAGMLTAMAATGIPARAAGVNPKLVHGVVTGSTFFDQEKNAATMKYPGEPWKANLEAAAMTGLYTFGVRNGLPHKQIGEMISKARPELRETLKNMSADAIESEIKNGTVNAISKGIKGILSGTGEMVALTTINYGLDQALGLDGQAMEKYHPDSELVEVAEGMLVGLAAPQMISSIKNRKAVSNSLYNIAEYGQRYKDILTSQPDSPEKAKQLENIDFLQSLKEQLDIAGINEPNQKRFLIEALKEKYAKEKITKDSPESAITRRGQKEIKRYQEIQDKILEGEDIAGKEEPTEEDRMHEEKPVRTPEGEATPIEKTSEESSVAITEPRKTGREETRDGVTVIKPAQETKTTSVIQPEENKVGEIIPLKKADETIESTTETVEPKPTEEKGTSTTEPPENIEPAKEGQGEPPKGAPGEPVKVETEDRATGITHAANEIRRKDRLLPEYEKSPQSFEEWNSKAEKAIKEGYDVEKLMDKIEKGHDPDPVENAIRKIYIATLDREIARNPTDELLAKQKRFVEIGDLANSRAGRNLVSLKGEGSPLDTISDFYVAKMEAAGVDKLTGQQKKETKEAFDNVQKADENATAAMEAYRAEISKLKAENELLKQKKTAKKGDKKDYAAEREKIVGDILLKLSKAGKDDPSFLGAGKLVEIAPDVLKLVKNIVGEGVEKLSEVIDKVYDLLKDKVPDIEKSEIRGIIAGEYNKKRETRNELAAKMKDIRDEAYYINKLERLLSGTEPNNEKKKVERNRQITELQNKIKDFHKAEREAAKEPKKEVDIDLKKLETIKKRNQKQEADIRERIAKGDFEKESPKPFLEDIEMQKKFPTQYNAALDAIKSREDARHEFDIALVRDQMARRTKGEIAADNLSKAAGTVKAVVTGIDDSAVAIQTYMSLLRRPRTGATALRLHVAHALSQKKFNRWLAALHNSSDWKEMKDMGLDITEPQSLKEREKEEIFNNRFSGTIKINGKEYKLLDAPLKPFERAFTTLGNVTRVVGYRTIAAKYKREGYTPEKDPELFKSLATRLNTETGRGTVNEYLDRANKVVTLGIWSPKLMAAKFNLLGVSDLASIVLSKAGTKGYYRQLHPKERLAAIRDIAQFATTVMALSYGIAYSFGGDLDTDPLSSTFLDVKFPNGKSYNLSGGFSGYIRSLSQFASGNRRKDGITKDVNSIDTALRFFRGKTPPLTSIGINLLSGKDYMGKKATLVNQIPNLLPISVKGIVEQIKDDGVESFFTQGLPTFVGFNVKDAADFANDNEKLLNYKDGRRPITDNERKEYDKKRFDETEKRIDELKKNKIPVLENFKVVKKDYDELTDEQKKYEEERVKRQVTAEIKEEMFGKETKTSAEKKAERKLKKEREQDK